MIIYLEVFAFYQEWNDHELFSLHTNKDKTK